MGYKVYKNMSCQIIITKKIIVKVFVIVVIAIQGMITIMVITIVNR